MSGAERLFAFDVEAVPLSELEGEICAWAGRIAAATCGWVVALAAFDRRDGWSGIGIQSCAQWLSWRCGMGLRAAREHLATGHALERLPAVREAFAAGRLSYSKARAIARVAEPATEDVWLRHATHCTAGQLERLAAAHRRMTADHVERRSRRVSWNYDEDGMLRMSVVLPADEGATLVAGINAARASLEDTSPPAGPDQPGGEADRPPADGEIIAAPRDRALDADALVTLAAGFLHHTAPGLTNPTHTVTVHIDATALTQPETDQPDQTDRPEPEPEQLEADRPEADRPDQAARPEAQRPTVGAGPVRRPVRCDVDPGVGLPRAVLRRLGCDGLIRALLADAQGNPLALGRRNRLPTRKVRDAIYARDRGTCQYPGCDRTRWLQVHHLDHWADHGDTDPDNLTLTCTAHHHAIHDENITLRRAADGTIIALLPDGRILRPAPRLDPGERPVRDLADATRHVTRTAIIPDWGGEPLSLDYSLHILAQYQPDKQRSAAAA